MNEHTFPSLATMADRELSLGSRLAYVALLLVALLMSAGIGALWLTEPGLPMRTQAAFGVMVLIGLAWSAFALWVLGSRRVLLAKHAVVAAWMAVTFTTLFLQGTLALGVTSGSRAAYAAAALGGAMLIGALLVLVKARRKLASLRARRDELARQLAGK
jgi:hypothetical protein